MSVLEKKNEESFQWNQSLIRAEFLKIYFDAMGVNDSLNIERLTNLYEFFRENENGRFLFAIARVNDKSNHVLKAVEVEAKDNTGAKLLENSEIKIMYPTSHPKENSSSLNFLELAMTGFYNQKVPDLYKGNSELNAFFQRFNKHFSDMKENSDAFDTFLKGDTNLRLKHNAIVDDIFGNELEKIRKAKNKEEQIPGYSLFFLVEGQLLEYISNCNVLRLVVPEGITEANVGETINKHINQANNIERAEQLMQKATVYYDDLVLFSLNQQKQKEETISSNFGEFIIILLSCILFIVNFMIVMPQNIYYDQKMKFYNNFFYEDISSFSTQDDVKKFTHSYISSLYDSGNDFSLNVTEDNTKIEDSTENPTSEYTSKYYYIGTYFYSGMAINYKKAKYDNDNTQIFETSNEYFGNKKKNYKYNKTICGNSDNLLVPDNAIIKDSCQILLNNTIPKNEKQQYYNQFAIIDYDKEILVNGPFFDDIFTSDLSELVLTIMLYNSDYDVALIDKLQFTFDSVGAINYKRTFEGYRPFLNKGDVYVSLLVLNIFYLLTIIYDGYRVITLFTNRIVDYFKYRVYSFVFTDWIDIFTFILVLASQIWFYVSILWRGDVFPIDCGNEEAFYKWIKFGEEMQRYQNFTGVCLLLVFFKLIKFIYNSFPALGIVFDTFSLAARELVALFFLVFVMIIGIFFMFQSTLGGYSESYYTFGNAFNSIYLLFLGFFDYERDFEFFNQSHPLAPYLFIVFFVIFQLILSNVFLSLIKSTFKDVKQKKQMFNDAVFQMTKDSFYGFYQKLLNLILFKDPEDEMKKKEGEDNEIVMKMAQKNWYKIFKYNLSNLQLGSLFKKNTLNLEEFEKKKQQNYTRLRKNIIKDYIEELQMNTSEDFNIFMDAILFIIYTVMLVVMLFYQLRLANIEHIKLFAEKTFNEGYCENLYNYRTGNFPQMFFNNIYNDEATLFPDVIKGYYFFGNQYFRVTNRLYRYTAITDDYKKDFFTAGTKGGSTSFLNTDKCPYDYENTQDFQTNIDDKKMSFKYTRPKDGYASFDKCGGYVFNIDANNPNNNDTINSSLNYIFESSNFGSSVIDFFVFSTKLDYLIYVKAILMKNPMEVLNKKVEISIIPFNRFVTLNDFIRMVIEIIYYVFFLYFFVRILWEIWLILKKKMIKNYEQSNDPQLFKDSPLINKFYRFTWNNYKNDKGCCLVIKLIFMTLFTFIYKTLLLIYLLVFSIFSFIFDSFLNFIDLFSMCISVGMFCLWFYLIHLTNTIQIKQDSSTDTGTKDNLFIVNHLNTLYNRYISWNAVNLFFIFIRLIRYLKFSRAIYLVFNIFQKAKLTIVLYLIFLFIVNLGFVFFGYALFNENLITFKTIGSGILNLFVILAGKVRPQDTMYMDDDKWKTIFMFFFLSFNLLVLLNFFYSILIEGYSEAKDRQSKNLGLDNKSNFFSNILQIIVDKRKQFLEVCERYQQKIYQFIVIYLQHKSKMSIEIERMKKDSQKIKNKKCCSDISSLIEIKQSFYDIIQSLGKKCLNVNCFDNPLNEKKMKIPEEVNIEEEEDPDVLKEIYLKRKFAKKVTDEVTIYHKIIIYIADFYGVTLSFTKPDKKFQSTETVRNDINSIREKYKNKMFNNLKSKDKWRCSFFTEYKKLIYTKATPFFKSNLFDKYYYYLNTEDIANKYYHNPKYYSDYNKFNPDRIPRFTKETTLEQNEILRKNDFFMIPSVLSKKERNILNTIPCPFGNNCYKNERPCDDCEKMKQELDELAAKIYDILINDFYLPEFTNPDDKDLYLGHYLYEIKKRQTEGKKVIFNQSQNLSKEVPKNKIQQFIASILDLMNNLTDKLEEIKQNDKETSLPSLYYYFYIWDTIYIILFQKNPKRVRKIRQSSQSFKYVQEYMKDSVKNGTLFNYVFINMNQLKEKVLQEEDLLKYNLPANYDFCNALRLIIRNETLTGQKNISIDDFEKPVLFFFNNDKYLLNEDEYLERMLPKEKTGDTEEIFKFSSYPIIFRKLWETTSVEKAFSIFFGYNKLINDNKKRIVFKNEILNKGFVKHYIDKIEVTDFFLPEHRAEMLMMLCPNKKFITVAKIKIKKLYDEKYEQSSTIDKIVTFQDLLNHFKDYRVNLLLKHKFLMTVFDTLYRDIKKGIHSINDEYNYQYHKFLRYNNDNLNEIEKIAMAKFFSHVMVKERFLFLREQFKTEVKKTVLNQQEDNKDTNSNLIEETIYQKVENMEQKLENEDKGKKSNKFDENNFNKLLKENPFVWLLSLDPFDYLDVCQKVQDQELREFYLELYTYFYGERSDYKEEYYLKRKTKLNFIEKYDKYLEYVTKREKIEKQRELLSQREAEFNDSVNYLAKRKEQYDQLYANWVKQKKDLGSIIQKELNQE